MIVLIDSDSLCYANGFANEKDGVMVRNGDLFLYKGLDTAIASIIRETGATDYKLFLSGKENFRTRVCGLYKANRIGMKRPVLLPEARNYLEIAHNAIVSQHMEADDLVCMEQTALIKQDIECCIAHIDKDIDQQEGWHYRWKLKSKPSEMYYITEEEGLQCLYQQALVGDKVDNIMHYLDKDTGTWKKDYGLGKQGARKALEGLTTEKELQAKCIELYETFTKKSDGSVPTIEDFIINMNLLYLLRSQEDFWKLV